MSMSKKDFVALADVIRAANRNYRPDEAVFREDAVAELAAFCAAQNPRFNRERWLNYIAGECGPNGGAITRERRALRAFQGGVR